MDAHETEKIAAASSAARAVGDDMTLGLGTGSTVGHFLTKLAERRPQRLRCVATSPATEAAARRLGLPVEPFDRLDSLDLAVDGADQVSPELWLVKGGGGAHAREKVVAEAADRFIVIVDSDKLVERIAPPIPLEVMPFGLFATLRRLSSLGEVAVRDAPPTPDGNVLVDLLVRVDDPKALARDLDGVAGVVAHGIFPVDLVSEVLIGKPDGSVERRSDAGRLDPIEQAGGLGGAAEPHAGLPGLRGDRAAGQNRKEEPEDAHGEEHRHDNEWHKDA